MIQNLSPYYTPFLQPNNVENIITQQDVLNDIEVVIDNLGNLYCNMIRGDAERGKGEPSYSLKNVCSPEDNLS